MGKKGGIGEWVEWSDGGNVDTRKQGRVEKKRKGRVTEAEMGRKGGSGDGKRRRLGTRREEVRDESNGMEGVRGVGRK